MDRRAIRNKKHKPRNVRPYDRPNQGILGKVASKMKGLLNPSWIFSVSQWMSSSQEQPASTDAPDEESNDEDEVPSQIPTTVSSTTHGSKRPRLRLHEPAPSILSEGTQTWLDASSSNLFNPSSHLPSTITQNTLVENKESPVIMNGDDHSENSEGSASTSGCSSLVSSHKERSNCLGPSNLRLSESALANLRGTLKNTVDLKRRDLASQKEGFSSPNTSASRLSLWSGGLSPVSKFNRRSPSVANSSQPAFNVNAFVAPSKVNQQIDRKLASPFYRGKTSFGGASSTLKMPVSTAPYQIERPSRNQIKVRSNQPEDSLEGMSSAAKRILLTLEKMSSPVIDVKKIPNTNKSPVDLSLYMMPPKHRSNVVSTPAGTPKGPPIANISSISKLTTLKSCGMRKFQNSTMDSLPLPSEEKNKVPADIFQTDSLQQIPLAKGGGKMKSKMLKQHQPSAGSSSFELEPAPLPNIPLSISTLPTFSFGPKPDRSSEILNKIGNDFVFSSPIEVLPKVPVHNNNLTVILPPGSWECYVCLVRNSSDKQKCVACEAARPSKTSSSGLTDSKSFKFSSPITYEFSSSSTSQTTTTSTFTFSSSCSATSSFFTPVTSSVTSVNNTTEQKAPPLIETSTPKPSISEFKLSVFNPPGSWECDVCLVRNTSDKQKCVACETPRPSKTNMSGTKDQKGFKFNSPLNYEVSSSSTSQTTTTTSTFTFGSNSSATSTFFTPVSNAVTSVNSTLEPKAAPLIETSAPKPSISEFKLPVFNPPGSWECDVCLVRNTSDKQKCVACETLRPSKTNMSGLKDPGSFQFNSPITFKFGSSIITLTTAATTTTETSTFTFGSSCSATSTFFTPVSSTVTSVNSTIEPKATSLTETSIPKLSVPEFKFNAPKVPSLDNSKPDIPVIDLVDKNENADVIDLVDKKENADVVDLVDKKENADTKPSLFSIPESNSSSNEGNSLPAITSSSNSAFKIPSSIMGNTSFTSSACTENKFTLPVPVKTNISEVDSKVSDSKKMESVSSDQLKIAPIGGFNFKISSSATSAFGAANSNADRNNASQVKSINAEKKPDPILGINVSTPSLSTPISIATSFPLFKTGDKVETAKTSEASAIKNIFASSIGSSSTSTTPTFNFSSTPISLSGLTSTSSQSSVSLAPTQTQAFGNMVKSQDVKSGVSVPSFGPATTASTFTFGTPAVTTTQSNPSSGFSFFTSNAANTVSASTTTASSVFMFGNSSTSQASTTGGFTFKGLNGDKPALAPSNALNFNAPATTSSTSSIFVFNASAPTTTAGSYVFGAVKTEPGTASAPTPSFGFGSSNAQSTNSTFSGFQTNPTATPFQFGSQPAANTAPAPTFGSGTSTFTFGKTESTNQLPTTQTTSGFGINTMQPMFGGTTAPAFGKAEKPVFNFGMPQASSTPVFQFGEKKQATAPQFSFGTPAQETPAPAPSSSFPTSQFNFNTPASFNFGAASTTHPGPFQFAASTDSQPSSAPRKIRKAVRRVPRKD
ncbi:nuclear pore complex protein Nup153-like isoform X2 [Argiope bruennichi]|uniref:nuclear pore complex protein Nup153-like isoform X2 n=1 Tax=Argiope bruennichi TaxID=94029 RepID=UPI002495A1F1|nr:nuclear pore complex protein Nup153-like isoform X2 [Argiope bruennichi]